MTNKPNECQNKNKSSDLNTSSWLGHYAVLKHLHWGHFAPLWCNQAFSLMSSVPLRMSREVLLTRGRDGRKRRGVGGLRDKSSEGAWDGRWRHMARMWSQQSGAGAVSVTWGRLAGRVGGLHCVGACALWLLLTLWWDWWFSAVALVTVTDDQTLFLSCPVSCSGSKAFSVYVIVTVAGHWSIHQEQLGS